MLLRGGAWRIATVTPHADCVALRMRAEGAATFRTVLVPFDRPRPVARPVSARRVSVRRWLHVLRRAACRIEPLGAVYDPHLGGLNLLPYQLAPALAYLRRGATRVLVADAVGLGKTVQAGLLLHTLAARQPSVRALVVTPAGLRRQWADELASRFGLDTIDADADWLRRSARSLPPDVSPWALPGIFIVSFDFLKRPEVLRPLEDVAWDTLVVDEAHNATTMSARRAAVHAVALRSLRVLLLTATPHAGDSSQYAALCSIGAASPREPIVLFRRSRADVGLGGRRRSVLLTVTTSDAERKLHRLIDRYTSAICRESRHGGDPRSRLLAVTLKKRALSSPAAVAISLRRRIALLVGTATPNQLLLPLGDEDPLDDGVRDETLAARGLADAALERRLLERLADAAEAALESKPAFLLRLLRRVRQPALVFTEYRDTLARLHGLLSAEGHDVTLLHGGQLPGERAASQRRFNAVGGVLLATDAAAEGLNLHERCRIVVHYELPWSPARMEQRTGRVDRIGQRATVHEVLLVGRDRAERLVLAPLARRAARARATIGPLSAALDRLAERAVADAVLDGQPLDDGVFRPEVDEHVSIDLGAEAAREAARLEERRAWRACSLPRLHNHPPDPPVVVARVRAGGVRPCALYLLSLTTPQGRLEHQELVVIRTSRANDRLTTSRLHAAGGNVLAEFEPHVQALRQVHAEVQRALEARARGLASQVAPASRALVQAGLFDRRAVFAAAARGRAADELTETLLRAAEDAAAAGPLIPSVDLVAVLHT